MFCLISVSWCSSWLLNSLNSLTAIFMAWTLHWHRRYSRISKQTSAERAKCKIKPFKIRSIWTAIKVITKKRKKNKIKSNKHRSYSLVVTGKRERKAEHRMLSQLSNNTINGILGSLDNKNIANETNKPFVYMWTCAHTSLTMWRESSLFFCFAYVTKHAIFCFRFSSNIIGTSISRRFVWMTFRLFFNIIALDVTAALF